MSGRPSVVLWSLVCVMATWRPLGAQTLQARVAALGSSQVTFHFTARPGVCGDGMRFMRMGTSSYQGDVSGETRSAACISGPVQVRLTVDAGTVSRVETWVGALRQREGHDFGAVPSGEAAQYLLDIATNGNSSATSKAIMPAVLAESAEVWPALLRIARDSSRPRATREDASFWLSRFAAGALAGRKNDPFDQDDVESDDIGLKKHAVFVLSQLPQDQSVPALITVARSQVDRRVRCQALFWLGQSGDARALTIFESILRS